MTQGFAIPPEQEVLISGSDSASVDAFGNFRVTSPQSLFSSQHQYNKSPLFWDEIIAGGGSTTHLPNESTISMDVGTASGDRVVLQSHNYHRYQPGKSQLLKMTWVMDTQKTDLVQRTGYFDDDDGVFFEDNGSAYRFIRRTSTSGSAVDNAVAQSSWNLDTLDGTGDSGVTLDPTLAQILVIDLQWLAAGRVRLGFNIKGLTIYAHEFRNANNLNLVYMKTANLPIRYEIRNTGVTASSSTLKAICSALESEGGVEEEVGPVWSHSTRATAPTIGNTEEAVFTIRPRTTFNSITNRGLILPVGIEIFNTGNSVAYWRVIRRGTLGGTPTWVNKDATNSITEYALDNETVTGGQEILSGFIGAGSGNQRGSPVSFQGEAIARSSLFLSLDAAGTVQDEFSIVVSTFSGTTDINASMTWKELY